MRVNGRKYVVLKHRFHKSYNWVTYVHLECLNRNKSGFLKTQTLLNKISSCAFTAYTMLAYDYK